jgi:hypothetical protein
MNGAKNQELDQVQDRAEFHLIDLVPRDCRHTASVDLETKLKGLEQSLNSWLVAKIEEIESGQIVAIVAGTSPRVSGGSCKNAHSTGQAIPTGKQEVIFMSTDDRDILRVLQAELDFIEHGGYGRSVKTPWKPKSPFEDSLTCINYTHLEKAHPCAECHLIDFVPTERREEKVPCHFIPLNESGETIDNLESEDNQQKLEEALKAWLRAKIKEVEAAGLATQQPAQVS